MRIIRYILAIVYFAACTMTFNIPILQPWGSFLSFPLGLILRAPFAENAIQGICRSNQWNLAGLGCFGSTTLLLSYAVGYLQWFVLVPFIYRRIKGSKDDYETD